MREAEEMAEEFRQEPYSLLGNNCIRKAFGFRRKYRLEGGIARVVICIGIARAKLLGFWIKMLTVHAWAEVDKKRVEVAMPLGKIGIWKIVDIRIKPVVAVWI